MAIAVAQSGGIIGTTGNGTTVSFTFGSATTAGSAIGLTASTFDTNGAAAGSDFTDNKSNTYQLAGSLLGGAIALGVEGGYNNAGTRGASHQCSYAAPHTAGSGIWNLGGVEITGQDATNATSCFDSTTFATASDGTSPFSVTAAGAVTAGNVCMYAVSVDSTSSGTWTNPTGYTSIVSDPGNNLCCYHGYKVNDTGTPTVAASWTGGQGGLGAKEIFMSFKAAGGGGPTGQYYRRRPSGILVPMSVRAGR